MVLWPFKWNIHLRDIPVSGFRLSGSKCDVAGGLPEVTHENPLTVVNDFWAPESYNYGSDLAIVYYINLIRAVF